MHALRFRPVKPLTAAHILWAILVVGLVAKQLAAPEKHSRYPDYAKTSRDLAAATEALPVIPYLPYFADVIYPLSQLPDRFGGAIWAAVTLGVLLTGLRAFVGRFAEPGSRTRMLSWQYFTVAIVGLGSLGNAQANVLILGCLLWGAVAVADRRWWLAAGWLALPGFKIYPLALGLVYVALHPKRLAFPFTTAVGVTLAVPFLFHPAEVVVGLYRNLADYFLSGAHYTIYSFLNVRDTLETYGLSISPTAFLPIQIATGAGVVLLLWVGYRNRRREAVLGGFTLTSIWFVTFGPSVEWQTYMLVAPVLAWEGATAWRSGRPTAGWWLVIATAVVVGPLQTSLFGLEVQRAVVGSKVSCWLLVALGLRQVWVTLRPAPRTAGRPPEVEQRPAIAA